MAKKPFYLSDDDNALNIKEELGKYLYNWHWFAITAIASLIVAYFYLKYTPTAYQTSGKIKILDESSKGMELPGDITTLFNNSKVNLENEIEIIKSHNLLQKVVTELNLNVRYFEEGNIKSGELWVAPFMVKAIDSLTKLPENEIFTVEILPNGYSISDVHEKKWTIGSHTMETAISDLPFLIQSTAPELSERDFGKLFSIRFQSVKSTTIALSSSLNIAQVGKSSEILSLSVVGENKSRSEAIINEIIHQFNLDGIFDRQLVSQRTIDFVDKRFVTLTKELDSIEDGKKDYKQYNSLSHIKLDTEYTIVRKANTSDEVLRLQTQLQIASLLKDVLNGEDKHSLLPANIGLENVGINGLITDYNVVILQMDKLKESAGSNNPVTLNMDRKLSDLRTNISKSVSAFERQSETALKNASVVNRNTKGLFSGIPEKEKILRAIERQQNIKESLYLLLLQKREEASINLAVTAPSIKVVDYAFTHLTPLYPKPKNIYSIALILGLLLPFLFFYIYFMTDSRIHTKKDLGANNVSTSIIGEIPFIANNRLFSGHNDRSILSEAFRVLRTNTEHVLKTEEESSLGKVIYVTSTIKGEGKTFTALNLACAYAALDKKTLLIGADFRNPQVHTYLNIDKKKKGLSNYLNDTNLTLSKLLIHFDLQGSTLDVMLSGNIPPTPAELLSNGRFEKLLHDLKNEYDYIIVDTAPTILVTDTLLIAPFADATIYVLRSGFSEKKLLAFSEELISSNKLVNASYMINGLTKNKLYGYSYNYGYNYGYHQDVKKTWLQRLFKKNKRT